jgi:hypothetical protein
MQSYPITKAFVPANLILPTTASGSGQSQIEGRDRSEKEILVWTRNLIFTPLQAVREGRMSRNFSKPFTPRYTRGTTAYALVSQPSAMSSSSSSRSSSLEVPESVRGRRSSIADSKASVPASDSTSASTQAPQLGHLDFEFSSATGSSDSDFVPGSKQCGPSPIYGYHAYSNSSLALNVPPPQPPKKGRFYSNALSNADKAALAHGELNHNHKAWTPKDMVLHHESRKSLVPQGQGVDKMRKMDALASIERDKQHSQQALNRKVRGSAILPSFRLTNDKGENDRVAYHSQATQSMYNLRSPSAPAPTREPMPTLARTFSFDATEPPPVEAVHIRAPSTGDCFSHRAARPRSTLLPSTSSSDSSTRVRSALAPDISRHRHNPSATFDTMLAPHKSGKGEVLRGSPNAKKVKGSSSAGSSPGHSPVKDKKQRRFSKMPSMLSLKKRSSRYSLRKDGEEDVPDVPSLPSPLT